MMARAMRQREKTEDQKGSRNWPPTMFLGTSPSAWIKVKSAASAMPLPNIERRRGREGAYGDHPGAAVDCSVLATHTTCSWSRFALVWRIIEPVAGAAILLARDGRDDPRMAQCPMPALVADVVALRRLIAHPRRLTGEHPGGRYRDRLRVGSGQS